MSTLQGYQHMLADKVCSKCAEGDLKNQVIKHRDHVGGWQVEGFANRQWLWVECPSCDFQVSLGKVDIPGKATPGEQAIEELRRGLPFSGFGAFS